MVKSIDRELYGNTTLTSPTYVTKLYEITTACTSTENPYVCDLSLGSTFYIPHDYDFTSLLRVVIKNVPMDPTKTYTFSLIYRQNATCFYASTVRCTDISGSYILGTGETFAACLFNGGQSINTVSPNLYVQSFSIVSLATSLGDGYERSVTSSVNVYY